MPLWAGQSAGLSACTDVSVFLQSMLEEVSEIAGPISDWSTKYREQPSHCLTDPNETCSRPWASR